MAKSSPTASYSFLLTIFVLISSSSARLLLDSPASSASCTPQSLGEGKLPTYKPSGKPEWDMKKSVQCSQTHVHEATVKSMDECADLCNKYNPNDYGDDLEAISCDAWLFDDASGECKLYRDCGDKKDVNDNHLTVGTYKDSNKCTLPGNNDDLCTVWICGPSPGHNVFENGCGECSCSDSCYGKGHPNTDGQGGWVCNWCE